MSREISTHSGSVITKTLSALVITCALAAIHTAPAAAQAAKDLDCKDCVKSKHIKDGKIKGKDLKDLTIENSKIADDAVTGSKIAGDSVTGDKIADGTVEGSDLAGDSVSSTESSNEPGVDYEVNRNQLGIGISDTPRTVISTNVSAPSDGYVTVVATGTFVRDGTDLEVLCSIANTNTTTVEPFESVGTRFFSGGSTSVPFSRVMTFSQSVGTVRYRLNCATSSAGNAAVFFPSITVMFFPTRY